jgi:hypothetical protein
MLQCTKVTKLRFPPGISNILIPPACVLAGFSHHDDGNGLGVMIWG